MRLNPLLFIAAALSMGGSYERPVMETLRRRKKGGGKGGAGVTLRKFAPTKQPPGYYTQQTPLKHMHAHARRIAITAQSEGLY